MSQTWTSTTSTFTGLLEERLVWRISLHDARRRPSFPQIISTIDVQYSLDYICGTWTHCLHIIVLCKSAFSSCLFTYVVTLAHSSLSRLSAVSHSAGGAAEIASVRKGLKYSLLPRDYIFQSVAFETIGSLNSSGYDFLCEIGQRLSAVSGDPRETSFLFQRLSILLQTL